MLNYCANGPSGYNLTNSLRFRSSASASLTRTFGTPTSGQKWTMSFWFKRGILGVGQELFAKGNTSTQPWTFFYIDGNGALNLYEYSTSGTSPNFNLATNAVFRDPSSWYHIVVAVDTTQATAANRQIVYVNNVQQTFSSSSFYPQNTITTWNSSGGTSYIGRQGGGDYLDGYLTEINFIDGQALTPSSFGSTNPVTGVWQPARYTGTYGTNGFYLNFTDIALTSGSNTGLGRDFSGNGNFWNTNNISVTSGVTYDAMSDVPTLTSATVANYCVWNPLNSGATLSEGNLTATTSAWTDASGSMAMPSGKWYAEFTYNSSTSTNALVGITLASFNGTGQSDTFRVAYQTIGVISRDGVASPADLTGYPTYTLGDIIGIALDVSAGTITFYKNNSSVYTLTTSVISSNEWRFFVRMNTRSFIANFGQRPFSYTPPTGFVALNTFNLPTSTIVKGNKYMDATLYTQNGTSTNVVTNASAFRPDLVWLKCRSNAGTFNVLTDTVRGIANSLYSNSTNLENGDGNNFFNSFNSNGFSLTLGDSGTNSTSGRTQVAWQWQAGQGTNTTNTAGSITSTVSVNTTAGFSIVTYTGTGANATVGHGLGVAPAMIIFKQRNAVRGWPVYHRSLGASTTIYLNVTNASNADSTIFNATSPTSSVFSLGASSDTNNGNVVAYCWAEIAGFSRFGSYTGNGSTDGPFIYTGFRPKYVMIKVTSITNVWLIIDSVRNTYNVANLNLNANDSSAENTASTGAWLDFTSNGFKIRNGTDGAINTSSNNYIYACFAENPFKNALAR